MTVLDTTITTLEMIGRPTRLQRWPDGLQLELAHEEGITVPFYQTLYDAVGGPYHWVDRKRMGDAELAAILSHQKVEVHVLRVGGMPAGFFELDGREPGSVTLAYFGIRETFQGLGLGRCLLSAAIEAAWDMGAERLRVETCTLDHEAALPLYRSMGFDVVSQRAGVVRLPST